MVHSIVSIEYVRHSQRRPTAALIDRRLYAVASRDEYKTRQEVERFAVQLTHSRRTTLKGTSNGSSSSFFPGNSTATAETALYKFCELGYSDIKRVQYCLVSRVRQASWRCCSYVLWNVVRFDTSVRKYSFSKCLMLVQFFLVFQLRFRGLW